jgi:serine/threonine protein kinase
MKEGDVIDGRFELLELVGEGGMGKVFRTADRETGTVVATKFPTEQHNEDRARFAREAEVLAELSHPGIVRYVAHGSLPEGQDYLVMEWAEGETLATRLRGDGLTVKDSVTLVRRVAEALAQAHGRGVIHRDIKPSNIVIPGGRVEDAILIDFGIARRTVEVSGLTRTGVMVGTPSYMAPEQARAERTIDARADVFGLGCLLYECVSGTPPFGGGYWMSIRLKVLLSDPAPLATIRADLPAALSDLAQRMLEKDCENRPADAGVVAAELELIERSTTLQGEAPPQTSGAPGALPPGRTVAARPSALALDAAKSSDSFVILALAHDGDDEESDPAPEALRQIDAGLRGSVEALGGSLEIMPDGAIAVRVTGAAHGAEVAVRAAMCAFAMRRVLPGAPIVLSLAERDNELNANLERGVHFLVKTALRAIFAATTEAGADPPDADIAIDEKAAERLDGRFRISRSDAGYVLRVELGD